ncbi:MAG: hypothetical protein AB8B96_13825 [Lysobacterales bacterium]
MAKIRYFAAQKWIAVALLAATAGACGNKGELYRPEPEVTAARLMVPDSLGRNAVSGSLTTYVLAAVPFGSITYR